MSGERTGDPGERPGAAPEAGPLLDAADEAELAAALSGRTWELLAREDRDRDDDDRMVHTAHAARYHRGEVGSAVDRVRGDWLCARVYAVLARSEPALHHAQRALEVCLEEELAGFDLAYCYEALARAHGVAGEYEQARLRAHQAVEAADETAGEDERAMLRADVATIPAVDPFW